MTSLSLTACAFFTLIHIKALLGKYLTNLGCLSGGGETARKCEALERESTLSGLWFLELFLTRQFLIFKAQGFKKNKGKGCY